MRRGKQMVAVAIFRGDNKARQYAAGLYGKKLNGVRIDAVRSYNPDDTIDDPLRGAQVVASCGFFEANEHIFTQHGLDREDVHFGCGFCMEAAFTVLG